MHQDAGICIRMWCHRPWVGPYLLRAGGQDDGSLFTQTPSNYIMLYGHVWKPPAKCSSKEALKITSWASETSLKHLPRRNRPPGQPGAKHTRIGYTPGIRGHVRRGLVAPGETTYGHPTHLLRALFSLILGIRRGIRRIYIYIYIY